ncbi:GntR family transcriptional regulator [Ktedonospora formicarum]|uniref:GntR family transcriptional regulator n=1 Tax=Ktedonospora formicarum TaxID=2778364 RepID=A0A8J3MV95_9CHLR|nr:GntR family transcriptional regulator [Ktedonospora formicarum]GHO47443.1 GntR family transcriptional regulator [Ktedonospora formicarum]
MPIPEQVEKFQRPLARKEVYTTLQKWIVEGVYQPGEIMRDHDLAEALGVSRTPVREALQRLEDEGFVQTAANRWTRVAQINLDEAKNLYPIIWSLEALAISLAQERLTGEHIDAMDKANTRFQQALATGQAIEASQADYDFHQVFIHQSDNPDLIRMLREVKMRLRWLEITYFRGDTLATTSLDEHEAILEALRTDEHKRAIQAVKANWQESLKRVLAQKKR